MKYNGPRYKKVNLPFQEDDKPRGGVVGVKFLEIVDGDTAHFLVYNEDVTVRFLAIDTPELHPSAMPFAKEAKEFTNKILSHAKSIQLQSDVSDSLYDDTESHRLLAWIWADKKLLNYQLVEEGFATVRYVYSDKLLYLDDLYYAQKRAIANKKGIHSIKNDERMSA